MCEMQLRSGKMFDFSMKMQQFLQMKQLFLSACAQMLIVKNKFEPVTDSDIDFESNAAMMNHFKWFVEKAENRQTVTSEALDTFYGINVGNNCRKTERVLKL